jgi:two-component system, chemotaxis family, CheB/CheR fusion protein
MALEKKDENNNGNEHKHLPVVAIGGSTGGLQAVTEILKNLPEKTGLAYVYIQHPNPDCETLSPEVLQRDTPMKVVEAADNVTLEPDHFYIIPPNANMVVDNGGMVNNGEAAGQARIMPVDHFFTTLAEKRKETAIGIVLSGSSLDGTAGLKAIKEGGGLTYAQDDSAQSQAMPRAAIEEDVVDAVLSPKGIAAELGRLSKQINLLYSLSAENIDDEDDAEEEIEVNELLKVKPEDINAILRIVKTAVGVDFSNYKRSTINRRIIRRMLLLKLQNLPAYIDYLKSKKQEVILLYRDLLINVTHFFRDPDAVQYLEKKLLPKILHDKPVTQPLRVWVPACSSGEEAYSLVMLILEAMEATGISTSLQIFASDLSDTAIHKARAGIYSKADLVNVSPERLARFFTKFEGQYRISKSLRELVVFTTHNIIKDPPFSRVDIISCCNLLIYLDTMLQNRVISNFHYSLNTGGYLILGKSETVGNLANLFKPIDKTIKIFSRRNETAARGHFELSTLPPEAELLPARQPKTKETAETPATPPTLDRAIDGLLLNQYTPPAVVVTHDLEIVQFRGSTSTFLEPSPGKASLNLLKMARSGLALELRNAANKVIKTGLPEKRSGLEVNYHGSNYDVGFEIVPLDGLTKDQLLLILFNQQRVVAQSEQKQSYSKDRRVKQLEAELIALREDMRAIVEEQEAANEELQSANEEIVSSNEELQSMNEELETSKEELESTNEELLTINEELMVRNEQLAEAHGYAESIIATIRESVLVLDENLRIKSANRSFYKTFKLRPDETEGYLIFEVGNSQWNIPKLRELLEDIIPANSKFHGFEVKHNFVDVGEKVMVMNARRVVQNANKQERILLAIEDITEHKQAEKLIEERENWLRNMANNVPVMIWVANAERNFTFLNNTWIEFTGRSLTQETGIGWMEGVYKDDLERLISVYNTSFNQKQPYEIEYRMRRHDGEYRWVLNRAVPSFTDGKFTGFTGSVTEVHDKRLLNEELEHRVQERTLELQDANRNLERSNNELQQFAYVASHDLQEPLRKITTFSNRLREKYSEPLPDTAKEYVEKINQASERMRRLIDDVLNFSRMVRSSKEFVRTDLNEVFQDVIRDYDLKIQEKNAVVNVGRLPVMQAIPLQMHQLFQNLLSNALKFTAKDVAPEINVLCDLATAEELQPYPRLTPSLKYYKIAFKDNGIGFSQEYADQVFVIFQRLNDKEEFSGTGIGLALCRKIVRNHGGEIFAESEEGKGTTFYIIVPTEQQPNG